VAGGCLYTMSVHYMQVVGCLRSISSVSPWYPLVGSIRDGHVGDEQTHIPPEPYSPALRNGYSWMACHRIPDRSGTRVGFDALLPTELRSSNKRHHKNNFIVYCAQSTTASLGGPRQRLDLASRMTIDAEQHTETITVHMASTRPRTITPTYLLQLTYQYQATERTVAIRLYSLFLLK